MECKISLQLTNYNKETGKKEKVDTPNLGNIPSDQKLTLDILAQAIANLSKEERSTLAAQLRAAKVQNITKDTVEKRQIMSNITLNDLVSQYPDLAKYDIPKDLEYDFTLLRCYKAEFNGSVYKGRTVDSKGNEIFIINNMWDAEKLFKHLSVKRNLANFIQGNNIDESLSEYAEDLTTIAKRYKRNVQELIEDFLIDKNAYSTFKQGDKLYSPKRIINKVLSQITGTLYDEGDKSDLQLELEAIKERGSSNNEWKIEKKKLYEVLTTFFEDFEKTYSLQQFKDLDTDTLNNILTQLFADDIKLLRATVKSSTQGQKIIKEAPKEKKRVNIKVDDVQKMYESTIKAAMPETPKRFQDAAKKYGQGFKDAFDSVKLTYTDETGTTHDVHLEMDEEYKVKVFYEVDQEAKVVEKDSYVTLDMRNWSPIGEIYDFSYASQPLFTLTEQYKGFYIYEFHKNGKTHYATSRSIISPKAYMKTFSSLEYAKQNIDENKDTIKSCGLWSIKQHAGRPRVSELEMKGIREGQIITTLDLQLPSYNYQNFSDSVKQLFEGTVENFHSVLSFIENIESLDTPEKAAAFIYLAHKHLKTNQDFFKTLSEKKDEVQKIIKTIVESKTISYLAEKEQNYGKRSEYYLKLLQNNGDNIDLDGKFSDITVQDFMDQNLTEAIEYFNKSFGINIHAVTRSELEQISQKQNLGLENKLDIVKAFVYNGEIYINTSNANAEDLFHELSHILLGVIKAKDLTMYQEVISKYTGKRGFQYQFNAHKKSYQHYSEQDVIEETVADMIAKEMFDSRQLLEQGFSGDQFVSMFENIFNKSQRFVQIGDNGLGFSKYMKQLLDENTDAMQRNMRISELVRQYINDGIIKEYCD